MMFIEAGSQYGSAWTRYTDEFSPNVWLVTLIFIIASALVIVPVLNKNRAISSRLTISDGFTLVFGMMSLQGWFFYSLYYGNSTIITKSPSPKAVITKK